MAKGKKGKEDACPGHRGGSRDYDCEYKTYHGKKDKVLDRSARNAAHEEMQPKKDEETDHKDGNPRNNSKGNLRNVKKETNRRKGPKSLVELRIMVVRGKLAPKGKGHKKKKKTKRKRKES